MYPPLYWVLIPHNTVGIGRIRKHSSISIFSTNKRTTSSLRHTLQCTEAMCIICWQIESRFINKISNITCCVYVVKGRKSYFCEFVCPRLKVFEGKGVRSQLVQRSQNAQRNCVYAGMTLQHRLAFQRSESERTMQGYVRMYASLDLTA